MFGDKMNKTLVLCSVGGTVSAGVLHILALCGIALGGGILLIAMCALLFICFGSAMRGAGWRGLWECQGRLDLRSGMPRVVLCGLVVLLLYGIVQGFRGGSVSYGPGETLGPEKAAIFYSAMLSLFALASLLHIAASTEGPPNKATSPNGGPAMQSGNSGAGGGPPSVS